MKEYYFKSDKRIRIVHVLFTFLIILFIAASANAQVVEAVMELPIEHLREETRVKLADFTDKIQYYVNSYQWCEDKWGYILPININLVLTDISSGSEERYNCTNMVIDNNYDMQFADKRWKFAYRSSDVLIHEEGALNSLTSLIDYYIYLMLGHEFDKSSTLGGDIYYEKARDIAENARFGMGRFNEGWDRRLDLARELLSDQHKPFREMVDYYFYGLSFVGEDNAEARKHCATAVRMLDKILADDPENEYCEKFINAHHIELLEIFKRAKDKSILRLLTVIDPDHERAYQEFLR